MLIGIFKRRNRTNIKDNTKIEVREQDFKAFCRIILFIHIYSVEQSPSCEANRFLASQEIPRILWEPKNHYRIHKCPPPAPVLGQIDQVHALTSHCLKIHLNIILQLSLGLPVGLFPSGFPTKTLYTPVLSPKRATCPAHLILLDLITRTLMGEKRAKENCHNRQFVNSMMHSMMNGMMNTVLNKDGECLSIGFRIDFNP